MLGACNTSGPKQRDLQERHQFPSVWGLQLLTNHTPVALEMTGGRYHIYYWTRARWKKDTLLHFKSDGLRAKFARGFMQKDPDVPRLPQQVQHRASRPRCVRSSEWKGLMRLCVGKQCNGTRTSDGNSQVFPFDLGTGSCFFVADAHSGDAGMFAAIVPNSDTALRSEDGGRMPVIALNFGTDEQDYIYIYTYLRKPWNV